MVQWFGFVKKSVSVEFDADESEAEFAVIAGF